MRSQRPISRALVSKQSVSSASAYSKASTKKSDGGKVCAGNALCAHTAQHTLVWRQQSQPWRVRGCPASGTGGITTPLHWLFLLRAPQICGTVRDDLMIWLLFFPRTEDRGQRRDITCHHPRAACCLSCWCVQPCAARSYVRGDRCPRSMSDEQQRCPPLSPGRHKSLPPSWVVCACFRLPVG